MPPKKFMGREFLGTRRVTYIINPQFHKVYPAVKPAEHVAEILQDLAMLQSWDMTRIAVGSQNPVKIESVRQGFSKVWQTKPGKLLGTKLFLKSVTSPCVRRIHYRCSKPRTLCAGIRSWSTIRCRIGRRIGTNQQWVVRLRLDRGDWSASWEGISSTGRIHTPESMMKLIHAGKRLGDVIDIVFNRQNAKQAEGQFGLMTDGVVTRTSGYTEAVCLALSRYLHPELF